REAVLEAREVGGVGAVPPEDRLVRIADDTEVVAVAAPALEQSELHGVDILELVDEQVAEPPALAGGKGVVGLERSGAQQQEVVEVDDTAPALVLLVAL